MGTEADDPGLVLAPPLAPLWKEGGGNDFKVPTVALVAEVLCADGRYFPGRVFLPGRALGHAGSMRAEEWMNEPSEFFPFLPDDAQTPVIFNKREILVLSVPASADKDDVLEEVAVPMRRITVECGTVRLEGTVVIDMPENHSRVLDYLNRPGAFLTLRDGEQHRLVCKARITRVIEAPDE